MGTYNVRVGELLGPLEKFLQKFEGEVTAEAMAEAWNILAKKNGWDDQLEAVLLEDDEG